MDGLRWLLLFFGILVIAGIYIYSRRDKGEPENNAADVDRVEPTLQVDETTPGSDKEPVLLPGQSDVDESPAVSADSLPSKIVTLRLVGREKGAF